MSKKPEPTCGQCPFHVLSKPACSRTGELRPRDAPQCANWRRMRAPLIARALRRSMRWMPKDSVGVVTRAPEE